MFKWLSIIVIVLTGFLLVLLALGYLLKENEDLTIAFKQKVAEQSQTQQQQINDNNAINNEVELLLDTLAADISAIVAKNLTCQSDNQCQLVTLSQSHASCTFAINSIGAAMVQKLSLTSGSLPNCSSISSNASVSCQQNLCMID